MIFSMRKIIDRLLNTAERILKTDIRYILRGGAWLSLGQVISAISSLALSIAFARLLPKEVYGLYKYILSIASLLMIPTLTGIDTAVAQAIARGKESSLYTGLFTKIRWGTLGALLSLLVGGYYFLNGNLTLTFSFLIVAVFLPFTEAFDIYNSLLQGRKLFKSFTFANSATQILSVVSIIVGLFFTKNVPILIGIYFLSNTVLNGIFLLYSIRAYKPNHEDDPSVIPYGKHLTFINVLGLILGQIDSILVFHYLGGIELAIYAFAVAPTDQVKGFLKNITFITLPKFASRPIDEVRGSIFRKMLWLCVFVSAAVIAYIIIAPPAFNLLFPAYHDSVIYSQILSLSLIPVILAMFLYVFFESHTLKKELYQYNVFNNIATVIILFPMIYFFGLWGAVLARLATRFLLFGFSVFLVKRIPIIDSLQSSQTQS